MIKLFSKVGKYYTVTKMGVFCGQTGADI